MKMIENSIQMLLRYNLFSLFAYVKSTCNDQLSEIELLKNLIYLY